MQVATASLFQVLSMEHVCEITVDTSSNVSIVRPDILSGEKQNLIEPVNSCLRIVTGERAPIHGNGQLQLVIGSLLIHQELWIADIHDDCILGLESCFFPV